ncbi:MAG TPA: hypothetical protein EYG03_17260 [Planctomycetes bacterium]|nr:hypothetical protein [Fuerstiella sp.]HIK93700.1 hypothetical protein [Planctomycetota bacterium]
MQGRQPICNENGDVWVAYEGELYEYPDLRRELLDRGHTLKTHCDTEAWVHLYEDLGERVFDQARGQSVGCPKSFTIAGTGPRWYFSFVLCRSRWLADLGI